MPVIKLILLVALCDVITGPCSGYVDSSLSRFRVVDRAECSFSLFPKDINIRDEPIRKHRKVSIHNIRASVAMEEINGMNDHTGLTVLAHYEYAPALRRFLMAPITFKMDAGINPPKKSGGNFLSWRFAHILKMRRNIDVVGFSPVSKDFDFFDRYISPQLPFRRISSDIVSLASLPNSVQQSEETRDSQGYLSEGYYKEPPSPLSHTPLSIQIFLGAVIIPTSFYLFCYALFKRRIGFESALGYGLLGGCGFVLAVALLLTMIRG